MLDFKYSNNSSEQIESKKSKSWQATDSKIDEKDCLNPSS